MVLEFFPIKAPRLGVAMQLGIFELNQIRYVAESQNANSNIVELQPTSLFYTSVMDYTMQKGF